MDVTFVMSILPSVGWHIPLMFRIVQILLKLPWLPRLSVLLLPLLPLLLVLRVIIIAMISMAKCYFVAIIHECASGVFVDISHLVFISYQICLQRLTCCQFQCLLNTSCPDTLNILLQWQHMLFCFGVWFGHWSVHAVVSVLVTSYKTWKIAS